MPSAETVTHRSGEYLVKLIDEEAIQPESLTSCESVTDLLGGGLHSGQAGPPVSSAEKTTQKQKCLGTGETNRDSTAHRYHVLVLRSEPMARVAIPIRFSPRG